MSKWIYYQIGFLLMVLVTSCYNDEGNYDYHWVTDVKMEKLRDTVISRGMVLKLEPELSVMLHDSLTGESFDSDDYEYLWMACQGEYGERIVLGREKKLEDTIWLQIQETPYTITYQVTRKDSGLSWSGRFNLAVRGRFAEGLLFLTEDENREVELDIYGHTPAGAWVLEKGTLARSGFPYRGGGANCVCSQNVANANKIWIATGEATGWLDMVNFAWGERDIARSIMSVPQPVSYTFRNISIWEGKVYLLSTDGNAHVINNYSMIYPSFAVVSGKAVELAPFVAANIYTAMVWDKTNRQMVMNQTDKLYTTAYCETLSATEALKGMEMIYMQAIDNMEVLAILKDPTTGIYRKYRYCWVVKGSIYVPQLEDNMTEELKEMEQLDAVAPELMAMSWEKGFFYFAVGNKLYNYRSGGGFDKPVECNIEFDAPITRVQVMNDKYTEYVWVATHNAAAGMEGGKVYRLKPNPVNSQELVLDGEVITGLGQVKSIHFW